MRGIDYEASLGMIAAALASTVALASPVFAEWTWVDENAIGDTYYIDFDTVKENNGSVYYWEMNDYLKLTENWYAIS